MDDTIKKPESELQAHASILSIHMREHYIRGRKATGSATCKIKLAIIVKCGPKKNFIECLDWRRIRLSLYQPFLIEV